MLTYDDDSETDIDYPFPTLGAKGVKINDNVERLVYNSGYSNYNVWLGSLEDAFIRD
jgi:hypothetical protein